MPGGRVTTPTRGRTARSWAGALRRAVARHSTPLLAGLLAATTMASIPRQLAGQDVTCHPGDTEVRRLQFTGNRAYSDDALANAIVTTPSSWTRRALGILGTRRCLDRAEFPRDRLRLIIFYRNHGYIDAQVDTAVHPVRRGVANVLFRIREGRPVLIDSLTIAGLDSLPTKERQRITKALPVRIGGTFDKTAIEQARDTLRLRLLNAGYPFAEVMRSYGSDTARRVALLAYDVTTGPIARIDSVVVRIQPRGSGKPIISANSVRSVMGLKPGRLYRLGDLAAAQRSLFQTDAFQHIAVGLEADTSRAAGAPGTRDTTVTVQADLVEGYMHTARAGGGWATLDCFRTQAEYADRDFLSGLRLLRLDASVTKIGIASPFRIANGGLCPQARQDIYSDTLNYNVSATLRSPVLFGSQLNPTFTLFTQRQSEYNAYVRSTPIGALLSLTRRLSSTLSLSPEYRIDLGRTSAQPALYCAVFNLCTPQDIQPLQDLLPLAEGGVLAVQDRRDDQYNPTRGSLVSVEALVGSRYLGSAARFQFDKGTIDAAAYLKASDDGVFAARIRFGAVVAQGREAAGFIPPISGSTRVARPPCADSSRTSWVRSSISRTSWTRFAEPTPCCAPTPAPEDRASALFRKEAIGPWSETSNTGGGVRSFVTFFSGRSSSTRDRYGTGTSPRCTACSGRLASVSACSRPSGPSVSTWGTTRISCRLVRRTSTRLPPLRSTERPPTWRSRCRSTA